MKKLALLCGLVAIGASANAVVLYDQLNQTPNAGNGAWDGGITDLGSNAGLQVGQRVTSVAGGEIVSRVVGEFIHFADPVVIDALVQVFNLSGSTVGSLVGEQVVTPTVTYFGTHPVFGGSFRKTNIEALVSIGTLVNGNDYLVVLQPQSDRWGYLARLTNSANTNTFQRDYSRFGYAGGYGHTDWREMGTMAFGAGNANMLVEAVPVPEPATMAVIGFGLAALAARRRRK